MDDQTAQNPSPAPADDPSAALMGILKGDIPRSSVPSQKKEIVAGNKMSNDFLKWFIGEVRDKNIVDDTKLLNIILDMDEKVENGEITLDFFDKLNGDPGYMKLLKEEIQKQLSEE